jgi:hypothetical protein
MFVLVIWPENAFSLQLLATFSYFSRNGSLR